jgi:hypothetical protein
MRGRHSADRAGGAADIAVDMMDNASALPTCSQRQQQEKTAFRKWPKITHTTSRRGNIDKQLLAGANVIAKMGFK